MVVDDYVKNRVWSTNVRVSKAPPLCLFSIDVRERFKNFGVRASSASVTGPGLNLTIEGWPRWMLNQLDWADRVSPSTPLGGRKLPPATKLMTLLALAIGLIVVAALYFSSLHPKPAESDRIPDGPKALRTESASLDLAVRYPAGCCFRGLHRLNSPEDFIPCGKLYWWWLAIC
jgi:hypothetical protein